MDSNTRKVNCITFAPFLKELNGHVMDYHLSLRKALGKEGWTFTTLLPLDSKLENLPQGWEKKIYSPPKWSRRSVFARLMPLLMNASSLIKLARSLYEAIFPRIQKDKRGKTLLFFETFNTFHLFALSFILPFLPSKNIHLWILYRYDSKQLFFKGKKDRKLLKFLDKVLMKKRLKLFADTDVLAEELSYAFKRKVHLVPIPHTHGLQTQVQQKSSPTLSLWWPGVPRRPKGLHLIQKLCTFDLPENEVLSLKLSEKTPDLPKNSTLQIEKLPENLDRDVYLNTFASSDAILLPYNIWNYQYSSSGIFIEAVSAQKIPFVSPGLWISRELIKHDLAELILDFEDPQVMTQMVKLIRDPNIHTKLAQMSTHYRALHNESSYAKSLLQYL